MIARLPARYAQPVRVAGRALTWVSLVAVGFGLCLVVMPVAKTVVVLEGAPTCREALAAAQDAFDFDDAAARALASAIAVTADVLPAGQEGRGADLQRAIDDSAAHKETEAEQLDKRDEARREFEASAGKCAPERAQ